MCDFSEAEINALEATFPGLHALIWDFHREQAWERYVEKGEHGVSFKDRQPFLTLLRRVAVAATMEQLSKAVKELKAFHVSKQIQVKSWLENKWFPHIKRWFQFYRNHGSNVVVNTNNGFEHQNKVLKYDYLAKYNDHSVSGLLLVVHTQYLPQRLQKYLQRNIHMSNRYCQYNSMIPTWLQQRPIPSSSMSC